MPYGSKCILITVKTNILLWHSFIHVWHSRQGQMQVYCLIETRKLLCLDRPSCTLYAGSVNNSFCGDYRVFDTLFECPYTHWWCEKHAPWTKKKHSGYSNGENGVLQLGEWWKGPFKWEHMLILAKGAVITSFALGVQWGFWSWSMWS